MIAVSVQNLKRQTKMRWYYPLFACAAVLLLLGVALAQFFWPLIFLGPLFWIVMGNSLRCPRCRRDITDTGKGYVAPWLRTPKTCVGCGRRKDDIWPFQWALRPEADPRKSR